MKSSVADYKTRCYCVRIEPVQAGLPVLRFTDHPVDLRMSGEVYVTDSGYQFSGYDSTAKMSPDTIDLEGIAVTGGITRDQIAAGIYDNARVFVFATSWASPVEDEEPLAKYLFGKTTVRDDRYVVQLMGLIDAVGQTEGSTFTPGCPYILGSVKCGVDLDALEEATTVLAVTSKSAFQVDSAKAADWYTLGTIEFTTGDNADAGVRMIKSHDASGNLTLFHPFQYDIADSDAVVIRPGCRKRFQEDCITKFSNGPNFGGYPHVPTKNQSGKWGTK